MIKISAPEFLIAGSIGLFYLGHTILGSIFASLGVIGAVGRVIIDSQIRADQLNREAASREMMFQTISSIAESLSNWGSPAPEDRFDDSEYN